MNDKVETIKAGVLASSGEEGEGTIEIIRWSSAKRLTAAAKVSGLMLVLSAVSVFLPGLHFVLVPLFLIGAVAGGTYRFMKGETVSDRDLKCPVCSKAIELRSENPEWPLSVQCQSCGVNVTIAKDHG